MKQFEYSKFRADDSSGNPLVGGKLYTYVSGDTSTNLTTWTDAAKTSVNTNPIVLNSRGEAEIWFESDMEVRLENSSGVLQWTMTGIPPNATPSVSGVFNLVQNNSFEENSTEITNWVKVEFTGGTVAIDTSDSNHGLQSLKFTGTASTGGGSCTSAKFPVEPLTGYMTQFAYKSSSVSTLNTVQVKWYNSVGVNISTSTVYTEGAANPTSYSTYYRAAYSPVSAVQAEIVLIGVNTGGTTTTGTTNFDNILVSDQGSIVQKAVTAPVNYLEVASSSTGNDVQIKPNGTDTNSGIDLVGKGTGKVSIDGLEASQFLRSDADDTSTSR